MYVESYCEGLCGKYEMCSPIPEPEAWGTCDFDECVEWNLADLEQDPCAAEFKEFNRCRFERLSCEEHFVLDIETGPSSVCFDPFVALTECAYAHSEDEG